MPAPKAPWEIHDHVTRENERIARERRERTGR
ncbi:hypothetical protein ATK30_0566 [Amycolatopsis echigonensis]|uniref:Uncharacterized protein n=1 Tax=Amycolatopsis echigonensis TaxID=2576905 RepID=A0A2N3X0D4_9PSEU|nr:hypothetical protein ATK30_0566 [Amycolatopsis niigatensis]